MVFRRGPNANLKALQSLVRRSQWIYAPMILKCRTIVYTWLFLLSFLVPRFARIRYNDRKEQADGKFWNWSALEFSSNKKCPLSPGLRRYFHFVTIFRSIEFWQPLHCGITSPACPVLSFGFWLLKTQINHYDEEFAFFLCFFLGWRAPNLITRLWGPDQSRKTKELSLESSMKTNSKFEFYFNIKSRTFVLPIQRHPTRVALTSICCVY